MTSAAGPGLRAAHGGLLEATARSLGLHDKGGKEFFRVGAVSGAPVENLTAWHEEFLSNELKNGAPKITLAELKALPDTVWVESRYGRVRAQARVTTRIHPDVVGVQHGFGHTALGGLAAGRGTSDSVLRPTLADPLSGQALHKEACVRIVKA